MQPIILQAPTPRHIDVRSHMHAPVGDIQANAAGKNPLKIGITDFDPGNRKLRTLPSPPTGKCTFKRPRFNTHTSTGKDAVQSILRTDKANFGFDPAAPLPSNKCTYVPGTLPTEDHGLITSLRTSETPSSSAKKSTSGTPQDTSVHTPNVSVDNAMRESVFDRLTSPK